MEIEIVTAKKKLTKSLVNQMQQATLQVLKFGEPLGYVVGVVKNTYKALLIKYDADYYMIPMNYTKGEKTVYRKIGKWSSRVSFETPEDCDIWWEAYQKIKEVVNQIYI